MKPTLYDHAGREIKSPSCGFVPPESTPKGEKVIDTREAWRKEPK